MEEDLQEMGNPFLLFPEEVWDIILGMMEDSQDILNMIKGFPELDIILKKKRHLWLFEQVIPHVAPWLKAPNILACRGVCRRWSRALDNFLENHSSVRAYDPGNLVTGQIWHPKASSRHYELEDLKIYPIRFGTTASLTKFLEDMADHPPHRNPFVGRSVHLSPEDYAWGRGPPPPGYLQFWTEALHLIERFGKHIWFLRMDGDYATTIHFARTVLDCLDGVPNLKGLFLDYGYIDTTEEEEDDDDEDTEPEPEATSPEDTEEAFLDSRKGTLPPLPQLESLGVTMENIRSESLINLLLTRYSSQIRSLLLQPLSHFWKGDYASLFPNLTAFTANDITSRKALSQLVGSLNSPKLSSLELNLGWCGEPAFVIDAELLAGLKRFPALEHLEVWCEEDFGNASVEETGSMDSVVPSLKSFLINANNDNPGLNYKFLLCLPSLEYLKISVSTTALLALPLIRRTTPEPQSELNIREAIDSRKVYDSNVWELLPKLKEVTLLLYPHKHFSRAGYDYLKK